MARLATWAPLPTCGPDGDLGSLIGAAVATGTTCGAFNDQDGATCGAGQGSEDLAWLWTAPADDTFVIDLFGSSYDTPMTIRDLGCGELYSNDDAGGLQSEITFDALAGEQHTTPAPPGQLDGRYVPDWDDADPA